MIERGIAPSESRRSTSTLCRHVNAQRHAPPAHRGSRAPAMDSATAHPAVRGGVGGGERPHEIKYDGYHTLADRPRRGQAAGAPSSTGIIDPGRSAPAASSLSASVRPFSPKCESAKAGTGVTGNSRARPEQAPPQFSGSVEIERGGLKGFDAVLNAVLMELHRINAPGDWLHGLAPLTRSNAESCSATIL